MGHVLIQNPDISTLALCKLLNVSREVVSLVRHFLVANPGATIDTKAASVDDAAAHETLVASLVSQVGDEVSKGAYRTLLRANLPLRERARLRAEIAKLGPKNAQASLRALDYADEIEGLAPEKSSREAPDAPPLFALPAGGSLHIDFGAGAGLKRDAVNERRPEDAEVKGVVLDCARTANAGNPEEGKPRRPWSIANPRPARSVQPIEPAEEPLPMGDQLEGDARELAPRPPSGPPSLGLRPLNTLTLPGIGGPASPPERDPNDDEGSACGSDI